VKARSELPALTCATGGCAGRFPWDWRWRLLGAGADLQNFRVVILRQVRPRGKPIMCPLSRVDNRNAAKSLRALAHGRVDSRSTFAAPPMLNGSAFPVTPPLPSEVAETRLCSKT